MITLNDIYAARPIVQQYTVRTPLVPALSLSDKQCNVRMKLETTQPIGAFKIRGAINALSRLSQQQRENGVICVSTGNHGRALAYAARQFGATATICMSELVPQNKIEAIRALGADVRISGNSQDEAQQLVDKLVQQQGMVEIPPFDHRDIIAGQGTIGIELIEDWQEIDSILVGLSGGGLIGGIALAAKTINPRIRIIGISPARGAAMFASLSAGKPVEIEEEPTLADSLGGGIGLQNRYTFDLVRTLVDQVILVNEEQIKQAMRHLYWQEGLVTEGAAAVGAAVLIDPQLREQALLNLGRNIALIISGKNIDMQQFTDIISQRAGD